MIKLVVTDLDGTLLDENRLVSDGSRLAVKKARELGVNVAIATGRPYGGCIGVLKEIGLLEDAGYSIFNTGSSIQRNCDGQAAVSVHLDMSDLKKLQDFTKGYKANVAGYSAQKIYCNENIFYESLIHDSRLLDMPIYTILKDDLKFGRINIMGKEEDIAKILSEMPQDFKENYYIVQNETFSVEFLHRDAGKANALLRLCKYLGVDINTEVLVLGDGMNDLEMLKIAENSVAMANAKDEVKEVCKYTTVSNKEEGFAKALERFLCY